MSRSPAGAAVTVALANCDPCEAIAAEVSTATIQASGPAGVSAPVYQSAARAAGHPAAARAAAHPMRLRCMSIRYVTCRTPTESGLYP